MSSQPPYELLYHPGIPGRGEFIRLALEVSQTPYIDVGNDDSAGGYKRVQSICMTSSPESAAGNPPVFSPPALLIPGTGKSLVLSQTPTILAYLGEKHGLDGGSERKFHVAALAQTALDLNNEVHDTHHPLAVMKYYEEQKPAALEKATDVRANRIPKFLAYFTRVLEWNRAEGEGRFLVGGNVTYADTTVWQVLDGLVFAFPREMEVRRKEFPALYGEFYESVKGLKGIKEYLASGRRLPFGNGVYRYYPELDRQETEK